MIVPSHLDAAALETLLEDVHSGPQPEVFDTRRVEQATPYAFLSLWVLAESIGAAVEGGLPPMPERDLFIPLTRITSHEDMHGLIDRVQDLAGTRLMNRLDYSPVDALKFSIILSELGQNVIEHAAAPGWVASWMVGRRLHIGICDGGQGMAGSLGPAHAKRFGDRWGDAVALEAAFIHGASRLDDPGRGQGIKQVRRSIGRWGGRVLMRSGTARVGDIPEWDDSSPLLQDLVPLPGVQVGIALPPRADRKAFP